MSTDPKVTLDDLVDPQGEAFMRGYRQAQLDQAAALPHRQAVWDVIATVRDAAPRVANDAETDDIIDALIDAGMLHCWGEAGETGV